MRRALFCIILVCMSAASLRADDYELKKLQADWTAAQQRWTDAQATANEKGQPVNPAGDPVREFRDHFRLAAQRHLKSPEVIPILVWLVMHAQPDTADHH